MKGLARIRFPGGALLMPAQNRYDRELVFEEAAFYARRHGEAMLEIDRRELVVRSGEGPPESRCAACGRGLGTVFFCEGERHMCLRCVRRSGR